MRVIGPSPVCVSASMQAKTYNNLGTWKVLNTVGFFQLSLAFCPRKCPRLHVASTRSQAEMKCHNLSVMHHLLNRNFLLLPTKKRSFPCVETKGDMKLVFGRDAGANPSQLKRNATELVHKDTQGPRVRASPAKAAEEE